MSTNKKETHVPEESIDTIVTPSQWRAALAKLEPEVKKAAAGMTPREARYLVNLYYMTQDNRKRSESQVKALNDRSENAALIDWIATTSNSQEAQVKKLLLAYADNNPASKWAMSIMGIGPVIAAGLKAHIDVTRAHTVGAVWRFAGLDPTLVWDKGITRPWNAKLKVLCWKIGQSFIKVKNRQADTYGKVYTVHKDQLIAKNEALEYADYAGERVNSVGKDTDAFKWYSMGMLPPKQVDQRAARYATKLFLSHYHHVAYEIEHGTPPPKPYIFTVPGHTHFISPPNWPM